MAVASIQLPDDPGSELYFDPQQLVVSFRKRDDQTLPGKRPGLKVLRVVIQSFGWMLEDRFFRPGSVVTVGQRRRNTFQIPTLELPQKHPLLVYNQNGSVLLNVNRHFSGILQIKTELKKLTDEVDLSSKGIKHLTLPAGSRGVLEHGNIRIYFEEIEDPERVAPTPVLRALYDPQMGRWFVASTAIHLLILLFAWFWPKGPAEVELVEKKVRRVVVSLQRATPYKPKLTMLSRGVPGAQGLEGEGARAADREGRRGKGVASKKTGPIRKTRREISQKGLLNVLGSPGRGSALNELLAEGPMLPGAVDKAFQGNPRFGLPGERTPRQGKGLFGTGRGGGAPRGATIGDGLGTKGIGGGRQGPGLADFGTGREDIAVSATVDEEEVFIMGNIPKDVIQQIIEDHMGQFKYCYERQLQISPNLAGKVVATFIIGLEGAVTSSRIHHSTMGSPAVESCITGVLRRLKFPKPGGGIVEVTFPFMFRRAG